MPVFPKSGQCRFLPQFRLRCDAGSHGSPIHPNVPERHDQTLQARKDKNPVLGSVGRRPGNHDTLGQRGGTGETRTSAAVEASRPRTSFPGKTHNFAAKAFRKFHLKSTLQLSFSTRLRAWDRTRTLTSELKSRRFLTSALGGQATVTVMAATSGAVRSTPSRSSLNRTWRRTRSSMRPKNGLLEGAVIAFNRGEDEFSVLWPEDFFRHFSII